MADHSVVAASLITAFGEQFASANGSTLTDAITRATTAVDSYFELIVAEAQGTDPETWIDNCDLTWTQDEYEELILYRAAHLASIAYPVILSGSHENTSGTRSFRPGLGLNSTPYGIEYLAIQKRKRGGGVRLRRTG